MSKAVCAHCRRKIDAAAKLCPYCGADPETGLRVDTQAILQQVFRPKKLSTGENVLEYARQRQGIVVAIGIAVVFLILAAAHSYISARNATSDASGPAVPLTEVTDLSSQPEETRGQAMPELQVQMDGNPQRLRQFVVEPGAIAPAAPPAATTTAPPAAPARPAAR
ncbi:MAG TPA: zinc ribbon domain-containing protein [Thermoanaerobaculia bacterium]|nr:zinc ribbon domain-containing protein [Thermoanaerobaculia bacterium]